MCALCVCPHQSVLWLCTIVVEYIFSRDNHAFSQLINYYYCLQRGKCTISLKKYEQVSENGLRLILLSLMPCWWRLGDFYSPLWFPSPGFVFCWCIVYCQYWWRLAGIAGLQLANPFRLGRKQCHWLLQQLHHHHHHRSTVQRSDAVWVPVCGSLLCGGHSGQSRNRKITAIIFDYTFSECFHIQFLACRVGF